MKSKIYSAILKMKKKGVKISFSKRKDGGYRVLKINNQKFKGSLGNKKLLKLAGEK